MASLTQSSAKPTLLEIIRQLKEERDLLLDQVKSLEHAIDEETSDDLLQKMTMELLKQNEALLAQLNLCNSFRSTPDPCVMLRVGTYKEAPEYDSDEVLSGTTPSETSPSLLRGTSIELPPLGPPPQDVRVFAKNGYYWVSYVYQSNLGIIAYEARAQDTSEGDWHITGFGLNGGPQTESSFNASINTLHSHRDPSMVVGEIRVQFEDGSWSNWSKQAKVDVTASSAGGREGGGGGAADEEYIMVDDQVPITKIFFHGTPTLENNVEFRSMQLFKMENEQPYHSSYYVLQPKTTILNGIWIAVGGCGGGPGPNGAYGPYCVYTRLAQKLVEHGIATVLPVYNSDNDGRVNLSPSCETLKRCFDQMLAKICSNFENGATAPIVLTGWSMGGAVVLEVAAEAIQKGFQISGVATIASQSRGLRNHSLQTSAQYLGAQVRVPLLLLHGSEDSCLSSRCSESIFDWSGGTEGTAELKILDGNDHACFDAEVHLELFVKSVCKK
jgi:dienelactone hydrolase